jgi:hypothetical protein
MKPFHTRINELADELRLEVAKVNAKRGHRISVPAVRDAVVCLRVLAEDVRNLERRYEDAKARGGW